MYKLNCRNEDGRNYCWTLYFREMENAKREAEKWDAAAWSGPALVWNMHPAGFFYAHGFSDEYIYYIEPIVFEEDKPNA